MTTEGETPVQILVQVSSGAMYLMARDECLARMRARTVDSIGAASANILELLTKDGVYHLIEKIWIEREEDTDGKLDGITAVIRNGIHFIVKSAAEDSEQAQTGDGRG